MYKMSFSGIVKKLASEVRKKDAKSKTARTNHNNKLQHSKYILLTRSDYQGLDHWAEVNLIENLLLHSNEKFEISSLMDHFKTGYYDELWSPLMEYKNLIEKYKHPIVPFPPRFQETIGGYGKSLTDTFEMIPERDRKRLLELKEQLLEKIQAVIFDVQNGISLKGWCAHCPTRWVSDESESTNWKILEMGEPHRKARHILYDKVSKEPSVESLRNLTDKEIEMIDEMIRAFDNLGLLVKYGSASLDFVLATYSRPLVIAWHRLEHYIMKERLQKPQKGHMKMFEMLAICAKKHRDKCHPGEETFTLSLEQEREWREWFKALGMRLPED